MGLGVILTSGFFKFPLVGFLYNKEFTKWGAKGNENNMAECFY